ncbi:hypothetical protein FQA39_LY01761 [Lamprigera yunnana]|nr:hypothetical protein FQA39_LY01761 [Lamprigera yunnana]
MAVGIANIQDLFQHFAKFGDDKSDGKTISLANADKWLKQAGIIDDKKITPADTSACFNKLKTKSMDFKQFNEFIEELAKQKNIAAAEMKIKLVASGLPGSIKTVVSFHKRYFDIHLFFEPYPFPTFLYTI